MSLKTMCVNITLICKVYTTVVLIRNIWPCANVSFHVTFQILGSNARYHSNNCPIWCEARKLCRMYQLYLYGLIGFFINSQLEQFIKTSN